MPLSVLRDVLGQGEAAPGDGPRRRPGGRRGVRVYWRERRLRCRGVVLAGDVHPAVARARRAPGRLTERLRALVASSPRCRSVAGGGGRAFCDLYALVESFDVEELSRFARTIRQWEGQFLNYFDSRATNARSEARNLIIKNVKRSGFGFRSFDNCRLRVLYRCA